MCTLGTASPRKLPVRRLNSAKNKDDVRASGLVVDEATLRRVAHDRRQRGFPMGADDAHRRLWRDAKLAELKHQDKAVEFGRRVAERRAAADARLSAQRVEPLQIAEHAAKPGRTNVVRDAVRDRQGALDRSIGKRGWGKRGVGFARFDHRGGGLTIYSQASTPLCRYSRLCQYLHLLWRR